MVKGDHLQLRSFLPVFHNFKWFNIKAAMDHQPVIQKEVDELIAKGATEPSTAFVIPKHTCGLQHILILK